MDEADDFPQGHERRLLRLPEVSYLVGLRRSAIYEKISKGEFPPPVHLGARAVAWPSNEIDEWIDHRIAESRQRAPHTEVRVNTPPPRPDLEALLNGGAK